MSVEHIQNSVNDVIAYLKENPQEAISTSPPVTAVMEEGLRCRATGTDGQSIVTDMPQEPSAGEELRRRRVGWHVPPWRPATPPELLYEPQNWG